jgi:hypothetical protein
MQAFITYTTSKAVLAATASAGVIGSININGEVSRNKLSLPNLNDIAPLTPKVYQASQ